jgi:hypothetical protein
LKLSIGEVGPVILYEPADTACQPLLVCNPVPPSNIRQRSIYRDHRPGTRAPPQPQHLHPSSAREEQKGRTGRVQTCFQRGKKQSETFATPIHRDSQSIGTDQSSTRAQLGIGGGGGGVGGSSRQVTSAIPKSSGEWNHPVGREE